MKFKLNLIFLILYFSEIISMPMGPMQQIPIPQAQPVATKMSFPIQPAISMPVPPPMPQPTIQPPAQQFSAPIYTPPPVTQPQPIQIMQATIPTSQPSIQTPQLPKANNYIPVGIPTESIKQIIPDGKKEEQKIVEKETPEIEEAEVEENITLNFENADLKNLSDYMSKIKKINLIPDKTIAGAKVSLVMREPLTVDGAWNIFLTILEMANFSIIEEPDAYKIIPKAQKLNQPLPSYINVSEDTLPDNDTNIRYVKFLQNIGVNEIRDLLTGMLGSPNSVIAQPEINGLIITDKSLNIKSAMKIINELDQTGLQESVSILNLKMVNASDVKTLFDNLIKKPEGSPLARLLGKQAESNIEYFSPTTRIIAEDRTNSLILLGNQNSIQKIEDFIKKNIDISLQGTESPLHVYELQNTDATQIKEILQDVTTPPDSIAGQQAAQYGAVRGGVKYFRPMSFQVDKDGNRLIVSSVDKQDWKILKKTIKDLDKPQPQVAVETMFVNVNIEDNKQLGGGFHNKKTGQIGKGVDFRGVTFGQGGVSDNNDLLSNLINAMNKTAGATILSFGKKDYIWAFLEAIKTQENTSIITQPFITIANNTPATITSGNDRRIVSEESGTTSKGYVTASANVSVGLTPQINLDGIMRFAINITIKDFIDPSGGDTQDKTITTNATVANGQVLVLGGFVKTLVTEQSQKTPILGDIPILGWFAKYKKRTVTKQYTFIFIAPTLIKPRTKPGVDLYTKMKLHNATRDIEEAVQTKNISDPIHNHFFNPVGEDYAHKVVDFANARYQPTTVDIKNDPYYRSQTAKSGKEEEELEEQEITQKKIDLAKEEVPDEIIQQREKLKNLLSTIKIPDKEKFTNLQQYKESENKIIQEKSHEQLIIDEKAIENNLNKNMAQKENKNKRSYRRNKR
ncbi:MAG: secretin N-terminal domain-containing protein [bacterium]